MRQRRDESRMMAHAEIEHRFGVKLGSCPFCGSHNVALYVVSEEPHVTCLDCSADGPSVGVRNTSGDREHAQYKACIAWNGRYVAPTMRDNSSFLDGVLPDPEYLADARKIIVSALEVGSDLGSEEARRFLAQFEATAKQQ